MTRLESWSSRVLAGTAVAALLAIGALGARAAPGGAAPAATVRGVVTDSDGDPVAGAHVLLLDATTIVAETSDASKAVLLAPPPATLAATTDAEGAFEIAGVEATVYGARVEARGFGVSVALVAAPTSAPVVLRLGPAIAVEGDVVDGDGKPVAGATVAARPASTRLGDDVRDYTALGTVLGTSDADGRFRLESVPARVHGHDIEGAFVLAVAKGGGATSIRLLAAPASGERAHLVLGGDATFGVKVIDATSKGPITGAEVSVIVSAAGDPGRSAWIDATTGADGTFQIEKTTPGTISGVFVSAAGVGAALVGPKNASIASGKSTTLTVDLAHGRGVGGRVVGPDRKPIAGVRVVAYGRPALFAAIATTDADGHYEIDGLPANGGGRHAPLARLRVDTPGLVSRDGRDLGVVPSARAGPVVRGDVFVVPAWRVSGHVIGPDGKPVAGAAVAVAAADDHHGWVDDLLGTTTAADGSFALPACPWQSLVLHAVDPVTGNKVDTTVQPEGAGIPLQDVKLELALRAETPDDVRAAIERLRAGRGRERFAAVRALGAIGPRARAAVPDLLRVLDDPSTEDVDARYEAVRALGQIADARALPALERLRGDEQPSFRLLVVRALAAFGAGAVPSLARFVEEDADLDVRLEAARALGDLGPQAADAIETLVRVLGADGAPEPARRAAAVAIGRIGPPAGLAAVPALATALGGPLGAHLEAAHDYGGSLHETRSEAAVALGRLGAPGLEALLGALEDEHATVRREAAYGISVQGAAALPALDALVGRLGDPELEVRVEVARAIGAIGPRAGAAIPALVQALTTTVPAPAFLDGAEGPPETPPAAASEALAAIGPAAVPALEKTVREDADEARRAEAARALALLQKR